jgi:hypothetical protein
MGRGGAASPSEKSLGLSDTGRTRRFWLDATSLDSLSAALPEVARCWLTAFGSSALGLAERWLPDVWLALERFWLELAGAEPTAGGPCRR